MRKYLPVFFTFLFFVTLFFSNVRSIYAQTPTVTITPSVTPEVSPPPTTQIWEQDSEVTFVGKVGARSGAFLDWALKEYQWTSDPTNLKVFWGTILKIVYAFSILFVLVTAFVIIITRGRSITIMRFVPRFILIILLITFSFSLIQFTYTVADAVQGFFLKNPDGEIIQQKDLLYIGFKYETFEGFRLKGSINDESAFISLLLVKLTAITYYTMTGILLLRKVILWFFIIISPIFPLLLLYAPIRNTGKIWIGEFFRWLLYAPIFAVFLSGVVLLWRSSNITTGTPGIPLNFSAKVGDIDGIGKAGTDIVYPTAINILLGGPGQKLSITNSVNIPQTFALYVIALLMLWVVILLPFLLLQIFLDYLHNFSFGEVAFFRQIMSASYPLLNKYGLTGPSPGPSPVDPNKPLSPAGAGLARALPFTNKIEIPEKASDEASNIASQVASSVNSQISSSQKATSSLFTTQFTRFAQQNKQVLNLANLSVPSMRDIAKFEIASMSHDVSRHQEIAQFHEKLEKIANPRIVSTPEERENYIKIKEKLVQAKQTGNPMAVSILSAAGHVSQKATGVKLATAVAFPQANRVQQVSLDDYEAVKKMWKENYQKLEPPKSLKGLELSRQEWVKQEIATISTAINYLESREQQKINQAMDMVAKILPFLLIGGFSHDEVVAYLKAKLEAAKGVLDEMEQEESNEDTLLSNKPKSKEAAGKLENKMELPDEPEVQKTPEPVKPDINTPLPNTSSQTNQNNDNEEELVDVKPERSKKKEMQLEAEINDNDQVSENN